ncbi:MAG: TonB-dependent receptor, partial [Bacteroidota bacterium]
EKPVLFTDVLCLDAQGNVISVYDPTAVVRAKFLNIDSPVDDYGDPYNRIIPAYISDPNNSKFRFTRAYTELLDNRDQDPIVAQVDITNQPSNIFKFKTGFKFRYKTGSRQSGLDYWERDPLVYNGGILYNRQDIHQLNLHGGFLEEYGAPYDSIFFPFLSTNALDGFIKDKGDTLRYNPFNETTPYYTDFVGSSYKYQEYVASGYFMADIKLGALWFLNAGLRLEYTHPIVKADTVIEDFIHTTRYLSSTKAGKPYFSILPSINLKYTITENMNLRFAFSRSFRRPNFNEIKPGQPTIDFTNIELLSGNPKLRPTYSLNFDLSWEYFFGNTGLASVALYYKYVTNHIYTAFETDTLQNSFQVVGGVVSKRYQNAPEAHVYGIELTLNKKFSFLPGFLKNFGINANYTFTLSKMRIPSRTSYQPLPRQSKNVANISIFYESKRITAKLGLNYKDPYLYELNLYAVTNFQTGEIVVVHQDNNYDLFVGKSLSLDGSFSVNINSHFSVYIEANNLTNSPFVIYRGQRERPVKTEYYSIRMMAGLKYNL